MNNVDIMTNYILHKADSRGDANHGWLQSKHTFSFANYHNPERMNFGLLRVLNDDFVAAGQGFGTHPHNNMEIISIPLEGDLEHQDSMGNTSVIRHGDIQVMSAGSGVMHSEYNKNQDQPVKFLQIWVYPNQKDVTPRYDQMTLNLEDRKNNFQQVISPNQDDEGLWIHQNAWFHMADLEKGVTRDYQLKSEGNGLYIFVLEGKMTVDGHHLDKRDGLGVIDFDKINFTADEDASLLLMEVPMQFE